MMFSAQLSALLEGVSALQELVAAFNIALEPGVQLCNTLVEKCAAADVSLTRCQTEISSCVARLSALSAFRAFAMPGQMLSELLLYTLLQDACSCVS